MATKNFTQFDLRTANNLNPNDFVVGYKSDGSSELRTTVRNLTSAFVNNVLIGATGPAGVSGATGASGFSFNYTPINTNTNLQTNTGYIVNTTTAGILSGTLPSNPSVGHFVNFLITANNINPFVINRNTKNINSAAENLVCDVAGNFTLVYTSESIGWKFVPFSGTTTPIAKIFKANWIGPYAGPQDNLLGPSPRVPFNNTVFNSDINVFGGLQNPGSKTLTSILIIEPGYYRVDVNLHLMDLIEGREILVQIWKNRDNVDEIIQTVSDTVIGTVGSSAGSSIGFIPGGTVIYISQPNTYIYIIANNNVPFPGPFPSRIDNFDSTGINGPSEIIITKLG